MRIFEKLTTLCDVIGVQDFGQAKNYKPTWIKVKSQKKRFPEYPGINLGNSDAIANHITTRPRGIGRNQAKILQLS